MYTDYDVLGEVSIVSIDINFETVQVLEIESWRVPETISRLSPH